MVHKKHQSKRVSTRLRSKNTKRAADKNRKDKKEARLNPQSKRIKKDPGIPNLWPFKEKLLQEIEATKAKVDQNKQTSRQAQINNSLAKLASDANKRSAAFEKASGAENDADHAEDPALSGRKDNSRKAYFREFKKVLDQADVILEVLDARDPLGCRTHNIERMIMANSSKRVILILNKIDLVPKDIADKWIKYLRNEFPTIGFKASTQSQRTNISQQRTHVKNASEDSLNSSGSLGADSLIKLLKNYSRSQNIKTSLTVGVIGYPNVGKSSLINSLKRAKVCGVGASPGFTKVAQEIHLDAKLKLLDCPGIVFGGFNPNASKSSHGDVLLRNCIKVELLEDPISPVEHLLKKCKKENLMMHYNLPAFDDVKGFLVELARQRGFVKKGGIPDIKSVARLVLKDWNSGNIAFYTLPPVKYQGSEQTAELVSTWTKEFSLDDYDQASVLESSAFNTTKKVLVMDSTMGEADGESDFLDNIVNVEDESEDESEEDDEDDAMEDSHIVMTPKNKKGQKDASVYKKGASAEELELNPQANQALKKQMKKVRKQQAKDQAEANSMMELIDEENDGTDEYNFKVLNVDLPMED